MESFFVLVKKLKSPNRQCAFSAQLISNIKSISIQKKFSFIYASGVLFMTMSLLTTFSQAHADESPVQHLVDYSKKKLEAVKKITADNPIISEQKQPEQIVVKDEEQESKDVPEAVSDPGSVEEAVEFAADATGVRKDFLMGMLVVESDLGRNPGKCTYQEVEDGAQKAHENGRLSSKAWETFQTRRDVMKGIANGLGYDYEQLKVSCNPDGAYAGTGGAMGIPQFMPDIWMDYKDRIAQIVGKDNPDPWNVKDGVVAMALLVADTPGVTDHNLIAERNAAKMYLSGTTSWKYEWYANQIVYWSHNYDKIMG